MLYNHRVLHLRMLFLHAHAQSAVKFMFCNVKPGVADTYQEIKETHIHMFCREVKFV